MHDFLYQELPSQLHFSILFDTIFNPTHQVNQIAKCSWELWDVWVDWYYFFYQYYLIFKQWMRLSSSLCFIKSMMLIPGCLFTVCANMLMLHMWEGTLLKKMHICISICVCAAFLGLTWPGPSIWMKILANLLLRSGHR